MLSFAKASKALHITQPALSRSIKSLEEELGQLLFDRVGKKIELTSFGVSTVDRAQALLDGMNELKGSGQKGPSDKAGIYRLGLSSGPGALLASALLEHVASKMPHARIEIFRANTVTLANLLKDRKIDAMVVDQRSLILDATLHVEKVYSFQGAFLCHPKHPLGQEKKVQFTQLKQYPIASSPLSDELARILVQRFGDDAHPSQMVRLSSDDIRDLIEVAKTTQTVVLAAKVAAQELKEIKVSPPLDALAHYALVTINKRSPALLHAPISLVIDDIFQSLKKLDV